jgi:hypothetical protein
MAKPQIQKIQCFGLTGEIDADQDEVNLRRVEKYNQTLVYPNFYTINGDSQMR